MKSAVVQLLLLAGGATAFPGMRKLMTDIMKRQTTGPPAAPEPLIGDLAKVGATSPVGTLVLNCINGTTSCQALEPKVNLSFRFL
jgi:hypothetical protein